MSDKPEATVDMLLRAIAVQADREMQRLAVAIEERNVAAIQHMAAIAYQHVTHLRNFHHEFDLPGDWPRIIDELYNEHEYLRELALEIQRRKQHGEPV